jgi:hypothetical protein
MNDPPVQTVNEISCARPTHNNLGMRAVHFRSVRVCHSASRDEDTDRQTLRPHTRLDDLRKTSALVSLRPRRSRPFAPSFDDL